MSTSRSLAPLFAVTLALLPVPMAASQAASQPAAVMAAAALGDLSSFRSIAEDTLKIVGTGDMAAAKMRIKDLETRWDDAEATLKPRDKSRWTKVDKAIDEALATLRTPGTKADACASALKALIGEMDAVGKRA